MDQMMKWFQGILVLGFIADIISTPEMREQWSRNYDWNYYASKYAD